MKLSTASIEFLAVAGFVLLGAFLRTTNLQYEAVEHFDEGVYASPLWYDAQFGEAYPSRHSYAPALLSTMMEGVQWIPGLESFAPFLPSVLLGTATILGLWWLARSWFGKSAGVFIAAVVAMSDFHILYSRMALTDVACLFWIVVSVGIGAHAVSRQSFRAAFISGFFCGLAWWTKYTGWLPLAILCSGTGFWWLWQGHRSIRFPRFIGILTTIIATALMTFAPWWWQLQDVGGYKAVSETHQKFLIGWSGWTTNLAQQLGDQFLLDGYSGQLSLGLGLFLAALFRWISGRSTWNVATAESHSQTATTTSFPPAALLLRFTGAAAALALLAMRIRTPLILICISIPGLSGIYLWPVLQRAWSRRCDRDLSPTSPGAIPLSTTDLATAPAIDPTLGLSITLAWFFGLLLSTPLYTPYSRLFFPLLAAIWLAAAGGVSWWLESNLSVARRIVGTGEMAPNQSWGQRLVTTMLAAALVTSFFRFDENNDLSLVTREDLFRSSLYQDRCSIVTAAHDIADACVRDAMGNDTIPEPPDKLSPDQRSNVRMVIYAYSEPALLYHLQKEGVMVSPVSHLNLRGPGNTPPVVPTFVVFGPGAKRTDGFWEELMDQSNHLRPVTRIDYSPGVVSLLDMFDPTWLRDHPEAHLQTLEVHRVQ